MSPIYVSNGKILISGDGKLANLPCPTGCCGREPPGICCGGEWYDTPPECGICCSGTNAPSGIWISSNLPEESGVCCNGEWYPPEVEGECCGGNWYPGNPPSGCSEGEIYLRWGPMDNCCGCLPAQIPAWDNALNETVLVNTIDVKDSLCCPICNGGPLLPVDSTNGNPRGCLGSCCDNNDPPNGNCTPGFQGDCFASFYLDCCENSPCPTVCNEQDPDGNVTCNNWNIIPLRQCISSTDCATGEETIRIPNTCLGACCEDGVYLGQTTIEECNGCWSGLGSTQCLGSCADDSDDTCCEKQISKSAGITFTRPPSSRNRHRDCSLLSNETLRVTVSGTTDSAILIHGTPFGARDTRCSVNHSFLICFNNFNIEPVPCDTNFRYLDVEVCWEEEATETETLNFSGCSDITVWLGACHRGDCVTDLVYSGAGATSTAGVVMYGSAAIVANGSGPLVLSGTFSSQGSSCNRTLTLSGSSTGDNEITSAIPDPSGGRLKVVKDGPGTWKLSGYSSYSGSLQVIEGTLVVAADVYEENVSPFGTVVAEPSLPVIGGTAAGLFPTAALLVEGGFNIERGFTVAQQGSSSQIVVIGVTGTGTSFFEAAASAIRLGRDIVLQAAAGSEGVFGMQWRDINGNLNPAVTFTIGSPGNNGIVRLRTFFPNATIAINIVNGTAYMDQSEFATLIPSAVPVTIGTATLYIDTGSQNLDNLIVTGDATLDGAANLTAANLSGSGSITNSAGTLTINGTNTMTGTVSITGGTVIVNQIVSGPAIVNSATFTNGSLTVDFSSTPSSGQQFRLLAGDTLQTYTPVLTGAGVATGTYDSATSTLTIN